MRLRLLQAAGVLLVAASLAQAQTSTADGVDAFLRGDYQRAGEILKPIAESWEKLPDGDHVALLFMAAMYENGLGVASDPVRACALYMRNYSMAGFGAQAMVLLRALQRSMGPGQIDQCHAAMNIGLDHGFQPATFTLDSGHWIGLELSSQGVTATITHGGKEKRTDVGMMFPGMIFLPIEHTELMTGASLSTRRQFIELFAWMPAPRPTWTLRWFVFEVVRENLVAVVMEELMTTSAERPPSVDVRDMARLRVTDAGHAEWAVLDTANPRDDIIETAEERQEAEQQARARQAADARVDWERLRDVARAPALAYSDANGCDNLFVYGWSEDRTEAITVRADKDLLQLSTLPRTLDVASQQGSFELAVHVFERPRRLPFCTNVRELGERQEIWRAIGGAVTIELSAPGIRAREPYLYRATIRIVGAEFVNATGVRIRQIQPITIAAIVGSGF